MPGAHTKRSAAARGAPRRNQGGSAAGPAEAQPEPYDGPGSNAGEARGRSGSVAGTRSSSRPGSQVRGASQTRQAVDPAPDPAPQVLLRNVDFGGAAYNMFSQVSPRFACLSQFPCHSALPIHISLCVCVLRFSSCPACCQKTFGENECLASFHRAKEGSVTCSASHLQSQPLSYSCCFHSFNTPFILFISFLHSRGKEASHRGTLHYLNPIQHQTSILPTTSSHNSILLHLQHPHPTSSSIISIIHSTLQQALQHTSTTAYQHFAKSVSIFTFSNIILDCLWKSPYSHHVVLSPSRQIF